MRINAAFKNTNFEILDKFFVGPTSVAFSNDPVSTSKAMVDFSQDNENLKIPSIRTLFSHFDFVLLEDKLIDHRNGNTAEVNTHTKNDKTIRHQLKRLALKVSRVVINGYQRNCC